MFSNWWLFNEKECEKTAVVSLRRSKVVPKKPPVAPPKVENVSKPKPQIDLSNIPKPGNALKNNTPKTVVEPKPPKPDEVPKAETNIPDKTVQTDSEIKQESVEDVQTNNTPSSFNLGNVSNGLFIVSQMSQMLPGMGNQQYQQPYQQSYQPPIYGGSIYS